ncbi:MAG: hypothetical protein WBQ37_02795 [Candidatus Competibacter sp.]
MLASIEEEPDAVRPLLSRWITAMVLFERLTNLPSDFPAFVLESTQKTITDFLPL